jgi:hypothetical protein
MLSRIDAGAKERINRNIDMPYASLDGALAAADPQPVRVLNVRLKAVPATN